MKPMLLMATTAVALAFGPAVVMAQGTHDQAPAMKSSTNQTSSKGMPTQLRDMLQNSGFKDIQVMPGSFIIHAKDKDGNPVVMNVGPGSFTEMTEVSGSNADEFDGQTASAGSHFLSIPSQDELSSNVVGLDVYNKDNKDIGQIKDIALNSRGRAQAYILSVGGFLGLGEHYIAVNTSELKVSYNNSDKKWHATMDATAEQLKSAPEFKYTGHWNASKS